MKVINAQIPGTL